MGMVSMPRARPRCRLHCRAQMSAEQAPLQVTPCRCLAALAALAPASSGCLPSPQIGLSLGRQGGIAVTYGKLQRRSLSSSSVSLLALDDTVPSGGGWACQDMCRLQTSADTVPFQQLPAPPPVAPPASQPGSLAGYDCSLGRRSRAAITPVQWAESIPTCAGVHGKSAVGGAVMGRCPSALWLRQRHRSAQRPPGSSATSTSRS